MYSLAPATAGFSPPAACGILDGKDRAQGMGDSPRSHWYLDRRLTAGALLCLILVVTGLYWREAIASGRLFSVPLQQASKVLPTLQHPFLEFLKLLAAFLIGHLVTSVHRVGLGEKVAGTSMQHAQVLLCVAGALMMILIGDSLARAFGIAGGASIVRFRTPVEDPKDTIILFLLLGLGMACGVGAFALAGLGTAFLCIVLVWLKRQVEGKPRAMVLVLSTDGNDVPLDHIQDVLVRHGVNYEASETTHGKKPGIRYRVWVPHDASLNHVSDELRAKDGAVFRDVSWERPRKRDR